MDPAWLRFALGRTPFMQWLDLKVPPLLVWLVFAGAMFGVAYVAPGISYTLPARFALALALVVLGGAVAFAAVPSWAE